MWLTMPASLTTSSVPRTGCHHAPLGSYAATSPPPIWTLLRLAGHAAGLLLVEEAGGAHLPLDGEPFRVTGGNALPFTAARDEATARRVTALLTVQPEWAAARA